MTKQEKVLYAQDCISRTIQYSKNPFSGSRNIILETDQTFFEMMTFGNNAVIRVDKEIYDWCVGKFADTRAKFIMDGDNLYSIEDKLRQYGKQLSGEHLNFLHLHPDTTVAEPNGFSFELYGKENISELYQDNQYKSNNYENSLGSNPNGVELAIVARREGIIAGAVAVDSYNYGLWQIGIDTVDQYRGRGIAAYLVKQMAQESEKRGHVPFYATWSANIASMRVALGAGFGPVWLTYSAEDATT